jgi:non-ribosomal peptide synthetase component F
LQHRSRSNKVVRCAFTNPLAGIKRIHPSFKSVCEFRNVLVIHPWAEHGTTSHLIPDVVMETDLRRFRTYAMTVSCTLTRQGLQLTSFFDSSVISPSAVERALGQFSYILRQLALEDDSMSVSTACEMNPSDRLQIQKWNLRVPDRIERCVHDGFHQIATIEPSRQAICAWDGVYDYGELDDLSTRLAARLVASGVGPEIFVGFCFEKSRFAVVSMLAIMKAGGICAPLDPAHPEAWHRSVLDAATIRLVLTSEATAPLFENHDTEVLKITSPLLASLPSHAYPVCTAVTPSNAVYVIFT